MKNKTLASIPTSLTLLSLVLAACSSGASSFSTEPTPSLSLATSVSTAVPPPETFSDPFAYCAAVGQIDAPDARYTGPLMTDALFQDYLISAGLDPMGIIPTSSNK